MKNSVFKKLSFAFAGAAFSLAVSFSSMAAVPSGTLEGADESSVYGWVWDSDSYGHIIPVEISITSADSSQVLKTAVVKADHYQDKLQESIGDGYHGFNYSVDWHQFDADDLRVAAYAVTDADRVFLGELTYNKTAGTFVMASSQQQQEAPSGTASPQGPGQLPVSTQAPEKSASGSTQIAVNVSPSESKNTSSTSTASTSGRTPLPWERGPGITPKKEEKPEKLSLGMFTITGYCNCESCSGGTNLTSSGTTPQPNHTVSADTNVFPIGTRLMIDDIIYTVEDTGSSVVQNKIDIFYATHEEAVAHGTTTAEVFAVPQQD